MSTTTLTLNGRPVPAAAKPQPRERRAGKDWTVRTATEYVHGASGLTKGSRKKNATPLHRGMVAAIWLGTRGQLTMSRETWDEACVNDVWWAEIEDLQKEAKGAMPQAVMKDVSVSAISRGQVVAQPGRGAPTADVGIVALNRELQRLVADMAQWESPTPQVQAEFARRYGKYRETMLRLREQFTEAEGAFETAQVMLVRFMGGNDD